jgi:hypothetical protein
LGLFSVIGGILGNSSKKKAAKKAAAAQIAAAQLGIDESRRQFDLTRSDQLPWMQAGQEAIGDIGDLVGLNGGDVQGGAISALQASPLYQSLFDNGQNTILANGAATGGLRGGNIQSSLANFGRDTLSQVIQQQLANLGAVSGQGAATASGLGALGAQNASALSNLFNQQGAAKAGQYVTTGALNAQNYGNIGQFGDSILSAIGGGGGGGIGGILKGLF